MRSWGMEVQVRGDASHCRSADGSGDQRAEGAGAGQEARWAADSVVPEQRGQVRGGLSLVSKEPRKNRKVYEAVRGLSERVRWGGEGRVWARL